jgi:hypothetical protein
MCPDNSEQPPDFWKKALEAKLAALRKEASQNDCVIPSESVRLVKDLDSLLKIEESLVPPAQPPRWPVVLAFFCTLVIVSVLFFAHVRSTRIDLDATVSEITFTVYQGTRFSAPLSLSQAQISGVVLEPQHGWNCPAPQPSSTFTFRTAKVASEQAAVSVDNFDIPQGTVVTVTHRGTLFQQDIKLTFPTNTSDLSIVFSAVGNAQLQNGSCEVTHTASPFDRLTFHPSEKTIDMSFEPLAEQIPASVDIPASHISLYRVVTPSVPDPVTAASAEPSRPSTLFSGSLFFDSIGSRERKLREGERLEFSGFQGTLHMLHAEKDRLRIRLAGEVADVRSGESKSTLKPTWFDYLTTNHGLSTLWAAVLYCFGVSLTVMRFWRWKL